MSYPNSPEDPYGQGGQPGSHPGQDGTGGYMPPAGQPGHVQSGGQPGYGQPGGYPPPTGPSGSYPPPHPSQPYGHPGYGQPGHGQPGSAMGGPPSPDERNMAMFALLGGGILGFIVPLIIFLIKKDESPFVRDQAAHSLNFQLLLLIGYVISSVLMIVLIGYLFWFALWVTSIVLGIMGGMAANRGEWYRFPFNVKWVQ